jgi:hypothetical protein
MARNEHRDPISATEERLRGPRFVKFVNAAPDMIAEDIADSKKELFAKYTAGLRSATIRLSNHGKYGTTPPFPEALELRRILSVRPKTCAMVSR